MKVLIVGGAGYVGSMLVPYLQSDQVSVYDLFYKQDIIKIKPLRDAMVGQDAVIWLAAYSNNDLYQKFISKGDKINKDCFEPAVRAAKVNGIRRFIYASSVAAYGSSETPLAETNPLRPTTLYGKAKAYCEEILAKYESPEFTTTVVRSASVCGWSPVMRHDVTINQMINDANRKFQITVNGGGQIRSHIHILDLCEVYRLVLRASRPAVAGQAFNAVAWNEPVIESARQVSEYTKAPIVRKPRNDDRSYIVSGVKAQDMLGFEPQFTIMNALKELA